MELKGLRMGSKPGEVDTGSKLEEMMARSSLWEPERTLRASIGPKTSKAWKAGNTRRPKERGRGRLPAGKLET